MSFDVSEYHDLLRLLEEHPEWKAELRSVLLSDDLLRLPEIVRELAEAQQRTEKALLALTIRVEQLVETQERTAASVSELAIIVKSLVDRMAKVDGRTLEWEYRDKAAAYFGKILRKLKVVSVISLEDKLEEKMTEAEFEDLLELDLLLSGIPRRIQGYGEILLAVEVSSVVDRNDVERARRRASLLKRAALDVVPAVAGQAVTEGGEWEAREHHVVLLQNERVLFWPEALINR
jgi:hypothetical protein